MPAVGSLSDQYQQHGGALHACRDKNNIDIGTGHK